MNSQFVKRIQSGADTCVKCAQCLPSCPTYQLYQNEAESPRGRIAQLQAMAEGRLEITAQNSQHLENCLLCRACERHCPSHVPYHKMMLAFYNSYQEKKQWKPASQEVFNTFSNAQQIEQTGKQIKLAQRVKLDKAAHLFKKRSSQAQLLANAATIHMANHLKINNPKDPEATLQIFLGCADRLWQGRVFQAAIDILNYLNFKIIIPDQQQCCGALYKHSGHAKQSQLLIEQNQSVFNAETPLLYLSTGCASSLASQHPNTQELSVFIARHLDQIPCHKLTESILLHQPCSQRLSTKSGQAVISILKHMQCQWTEMPDQCCGAAGIQAVENPEQASRILDSLSHQINPRQFNRLITSNIGCQNHLKDWFGDRINHPIELLHQQVKNL
ncbi:MAG: (Fe-S)-binding protein [bacterium]